MSLFKTVEIAGGNAELLSHLEKGEAQLLPPLPYACPQGGWSRENRPHGFHLACNSLIMIPDNVWRFDKYRRLKPDIGPTTAGGAGFIPAVILPGGNDIILEESIERFLQASPREKRLPAVTGGTNRREERRHFKRL